MEFKQDFKGEKYADKPITVIHKGKQYQGIARLYIRSIYSEEDSNENDVLLIICEDLSSLAIDRLYRQKSNDIESIFENISTYDTKKDCLDEFQKVELRYKN